MKDPSMHDALEHQIDTEYDMIHYIGTMKTPYIAVMDGITSKVDNLGINIVAKDGLLIISLFF